MAGQGCGPRSWPAGSRRPRQRSSVSGDRLHVHGCVRCEARAQAATSRSVMGTRVKAHRGCASGALPCAPSARPGLGPWCWASSVPLTDPSWTRIRSGSSLLPCTHLRVDGRGPWGRVPVQNGSKGRSGNEVTTELCLWCTGRSIGRTTSTRSTHGSRSNCIPSSRPNGARLAR